MANHMPDLPKPVLIGGLVVIVAVVAAALVGGIVQSAGPGGGTPRVEYRVESDGSDVDVTYGGLKSRQSNGTSSPWFTTDSVPEDELPYVSIVAQAGTGASYISCEIKVDGEVTSQNQSTGPFAVVNC